MLGMRSRMGSVGVIVGSLNINRDVCDGGSFIVLGRGVGRTRGVRGQSQGANNRKPFVPAPLSPGSVAHAILPSITHTE